jgi:L-rhamnose isomerase
MNDTTIRKGFEYAKERYAALGVDVEAAIARVDAIPVSMHCWQGDDVVGFDGSRTLTGGIATTGNYPGRARTPGELRSDIEMAMGLVPGATKLNLHASYAEKSRPDVDRDGYTIADFENWAAWAAGRGIGLDFNPTYFSHAKMDGDFSLSSFDPAVRRFWIEHGKRCLEIAEGFAKRTGKPCVVNFWMPDGYKDTCVDTVAHRELMTHSLDEIFATKVDPALVPCAIESKLFGVGLESYTVASHEYSLGYAISRKKLYCLDSGHFHPTETVSAKLTATLSFVDRVLLHVSRGVRWDSDHVVTLDDELQRIMDEILWNRLESRVFIGLDYFDASIDRVAAWAVGLRNARKALLSAALAPSDAIRQAELAGDHTLRLELLEERKTLPVGAVWDHYCLTRGVPVNYVEAVQRYARDVLSTR